MIVASTSLKIAVWVSAILSLLGLVAFAGGAIESVRVNLFHQNGAYYQTATWIHGWAKWFAFPLLAHLAYKDLQTIPANVVEKFRLKHLGWMGWLAIALFAASGLNLIEIVLGFRSYADLSSIGLMDAIDVVIAILFYPFLYFWLGSLCLFARYRVAAHNRFGILPPSQAK